MRTISTLLLTLPLLACQREQPKTPEPQPEIPPGGTPSHEAELPQPGTETNLRAPKRTDKPTLWFALKQWPETLATVDGTPILKRDVVADLQTQQENGLLTLEEDPQTGLRAAATALDARVDALVVAHALAPADQAKVQADAQELLRREQVGAGGKAAWLESLKKRGLDEARRLRALEVQAGLHLLTERTHPVQVTEAELRERYAHNQKMLTLPAAMKVQEVALALGPTPTALQLQAGEQALQKPEKMTELRDLDWQNLRQLGPERWQALQHVKAGMWTPVVRTRFGLHRLKWTAQRAEHVQTWAEAKPRLLAYVLKFRTWEAGHELLLKLRGDAHIERMPPFAEPPGGLPLAGQVTAAAFEEDDD